MNGSWDAHLASHADFAEKEPGIEIIQRTPSSLWNPVNTDTKGTYQSVRIIRVSVLNGRL